MECCTMNEKDASNGIWMQPTYLQTIQYSFTKKTIMKNALKSVCITILCKFLFDNLDIIFFIDSSLEFGKIFDFVDSSGRLQKCAYLNSLKFVDFLRSNTLFRVWKCMHAGLLNLYVNNRF